MFTEKNNKESCDKVAQCLFDNAECVDVCRCPEGRFEDGEKCELRKFSNLHLYNKMAIWVIVLPLCIAILYLEILPPSISIGIE